MATILVTGGAGYVGSHTCKALAKAGHTPVTYDNLSRGHRELVKWGPLEIGDIRDQTKLGDVLTRYKPDAVIHFAAYIFAGESVAQPQLYEDNNVGGATSLLAAMSAASVRKIVVSSTAAVYGMPSKSPIAETEVCNPVNPYGETKLKMEKMLAKSAGLSWVALRYFNAAGADPDGDTGEWHEPEDHLIPIMLDVALKLKDTMTINGTDYPTPDGTCVRDYVHVTDLADAHVRALKYLLDGKPSAAFNLGTSNGYSVKDVIETGRMVTGVDIPAKIGSRRAGDAVSLVADSLKAKAELDWSPQFDLRAQIAHAWTWHQRLRKNF